VENTDNDGANYIPKYLNRDCPKSSIEGSLMGSDATDQVRYPDHSHVAASMRLFVKRMTTIS
jgi:hypothetical protein